VMSD